MLHFPAGRKRKETGGEEMGRRGGGRPGWEVKERVLTVLTAEDGKNSREDVLENEGGGKAGRSDESKRGIKYDSDKTAYGIQGSRGGRNGWKP